MIQPLLNNRILIIDDNEKIHDDFIKALIEENNPTLNELDALESTLMGKHTDNLNSLFPTFKIDSAFQGQTGLEAIQKALDNDTPYAVAFVDIRMPPGWDGVETIEHIWKIDPDIQLVICTAYSDYSWQELLKRLGNSDRLLLLKKPFDIIEIRLCALALAQKWSSNYRANLKNKQMEAIIQQKTEALELSLTLAKATLEATADGIIALDMNNNIIHYNKKFLDIWGIPESLLKQGQTTAMLEWIQTQLKSPNELLLDTETTLNENNEGYYKEIELNANRAIQYLEQYIQPQYHQDNRVGIVYSFRDVTSRKYLEKELLKQATYDRLTGLPNRALFIDRVQQAMIHAKRNGLFVAVLFADLDSFKYVNDSLGHPVGDEILKLFAERLQNALRKSDTVVRLEDDLETNTASRFGGDEFIISLLINTANINIITSIIQRLFRVLNKPYHLAEHELTLTCSIGVSIYPQDGDNPLTLIRNADIAMYRAKAKGKGTFEFYINEMSESTLQRLELENDLRNALKNHELYLDYQPLIDVQTKKIVSLEALMRWKHPTMGLVSPGAFIPIAEASSLILPIGTWAIKAACLQNKIWQDRGLPKVNISVNIAGEQFKQKDFVDTVKNILKETGLKGEYLELELTESSLFLDIHDVLLKLQQLKKIGVCINLDDFGTGYSSLSYINQFPIDKLKIDQSFIKDLSRSPKSKTIIQAVMLMAKSFHMKVVAEGVETADQLHILGKLETDEVQGFYLSKPMSVEDTTHLLTQWQWPNGKI